MENNYIFYKNSNLNINPNINNINITNYLSPLSDNGNREIKKNKKIAEYLSGNNNNAPQDLDEVQPAQGYKQSQQHEQYYYNNQYGQQSSNENIGQHNHNYKEEEQNESENEEGDGYFKRLQWEN